MEFTFDWITQPQAWVALATLTLLEIVLGIDNIIFISILTGRLPAHQQNKARLWGLGLAMLMRIILLLAIGWVMSLTKTLFTLGHVEISGKSLILIIGGLFLMAKASHEIHDKLEGEEHQTKGLGAASMAAVLTQVILLDIVFSLDSVITAVGMAEHIVVMILAVVIAVGFMMVLAKPVSDFVERHPTLKMLALSFLILIGLSLILDGLSVHVSKGYIYFAMAFSSGVEILNILIRRRHKPEPVRLRSAYRDDTVDIIGHS